MQQEPKKFTAIDPEARFITPQQAATILAMSVPSVYVFIRKGIIPTSQFGGVTRIVREEFESWLESTRTT